MTDSPPNRLVGQHSGFDSGEVADKEKVDGIVAAIMALDRCIRNQVEPQESIYESRGLLIL